MFLRPSHVHTPGRAFHYNFDEYEFFALEYKVYGDDGNEIIKTIPYMGSAQAAEYPEMKSYIESIKSQIPSDWRIKIYHAGPKLKAYNPVLPEFCQVYLVIEQPLFDIRLATS